MQEITSINNQRVKKWLKLKDKKYRDLSNLFLIEGKHLVEEALKQNKVTEIITTKDNYPFKNTYLVSNTIMKKLSSHKSIPNVMAIVKKIEKKEYQGNLLIIDGIQDPGNLGTIIRTSVAFDIDTIVLGNDTVDLYNQKTINASEGSLFNINFIKKDILSFIDELKSKNYKVYGTNVENGISLNQIDKTEQFAIIIGNEGKGLNKDVLSKCDANIYITINKKCESLNVAVATGIILHYLK